MTCHYPKHANLSENGEICPLCGPEDEHEPNPLIRKGGRPPKVMHLPGSLLLLGSNPQPSLPLFDNTVDGKRRIHCRRYENCLDYAVGTNWPSFVCIDCKIEDPMAKENWTDDLEGLADLLIAIFGK